MTSRISDKKTTKISLNDLSDDQDFNFSWDVDFSSDEDIFLKGKSEILWTRTRDLFESSDCCQSFSDLSDRTYSSCSWHNDDFDMKSSSKVKASLEAIENALYDKIKSPLLNDIVFQECCEWAEKFPYLRIKGDQVFPPGYETSAAFSNSAVNTKHYKTRNPSSSLHLEGKKLPIHSASKTKGILIDNVNNNKKPVYFEETAVDEGKPEEYFALHQSDQPIQDLQIHTVDNVKVHSTVKCLQEKVLDKLVSEMWPCVISFLEKLSDKSNSNDKEFQLPPIAISNDQKRPICMKRPKTEGSSVVNTGFPKLDSILTVSPKILQKRELSSAHRLMRPSSEMSASSRKSSKGIKSVYRLSSGAQLNSEYSYNKGSRNDRESENLCIVLPALQEDFQKSSSVLRGFHIQPSKRESVNETLHTSGSDNEVFETPRENEYFLPPIEGKNYMPSNAKLTKNLFTFYGTPATQDKNRQLCSAKNKKIMSRPNTSVSKKTIKNQEVTRELSITSSGLYITAKGVHKPPLNFDSDKNAEIMTSDNETEEIHEKSVALFPIVTSLMPNEDKIIKRGILHTFLGGRKR